MFKKSEKEVSEELLKVPEQASMTPRLKLVSKSGKKPEFRSQLASQLDEWADQLDAEIERIKNS